MNDTIYDLIDAIKEDKRYIDFKEKSNLLLDDKINDLLVTYQDKIEELNELKKYEQYIDLTTKKDELKNIKKEISNNEVIQEYYQSYYQINELLHQVTQIIFKDISDLLDTTGYTL